MIIVCLVLVIAAFVNPVGMENLGWKYYIVFCCFLAVFLVITYFFFPETKGRSLEEIAEIFDGPRAAIDVDEVEKSTTYADKEHKSRSEILEERVALLERTLREAGVPFDVGGLGESEIVSASGSGSGINTANRGDSSEVAWSATVSPIDGVSGNAPNGIDIPVDGDVPMGFDYGVDLDGFATRAELGAVSPGYPTPLEAQTLYVSAPPTSLLLANLQTSISTLIRIDRITAFLPHAVALGWFLNLDYLSSLEASVQSLSSPDGGTTALLSAIYVWGSLISHSFTTDPFSTPSDLGSPATSNVAYVRKAVDDLSHAHALYPGDGSEGLTPIVYPEIETTQGADDGSVESA